MNATGRDFVLRRAVRPQDLRAYLQANAWREKAPFSEYGAVWVLNRPGQKTLEALVPNIVEIDDYSARVSDLLGVLELAEGRPQTEVIVDIVNALADVIR